MAIKRQWSIPEEWRVKPVAPAPEVIARWQDIAKLSPIKSVRDEAQRLIAAHTAPESE